MVSSLLISGKEDAANARGHYHCGKKYYMQSFFSQQLISDYSYSRGGGAELFPITVTAAVAGRNYFPILITARTRYGKTVSNDNIR